MVLVVAICDVDILRLKSNGHDTYYSKEWKKISGEHQTPPLKSTTQLWNYQKQIQKDTRIKKVSVSIVSIVCLKNNGQKRFGYGWRKKNIMGRLSTITTYLNM